MRKRFIAGGCLGCFITCGLLSIVAGLFVYRLSEAVSSFTLQGPNIDVNQIYTAAIAEAVKNGTVQQKLEFLNLLVANKQQAAAWQPIFGAQLEPLLNDPNEKVRLAAVATFEVIDPTALVRATGPPPPAMPRDRSHGPGDHATFGDADD